jgi:hypothetical protein
MLVNMLQDSAKIQIVHRLIKVEQMWLNKEYTRKGNGKTPTTTHIFCRMGSWLKPRPWRILLALVSDAFPLLEFLVRGLKVASSTLSAMRLSTFNLFATGGHDEVNGVDVGWICLTTKEVDVDVWNFNVV